MCLLDPWTFYDFDHLVLLLSGIDIKPSLGVMRHFFGNTRTNILIWVVRSQTIVNFLLLCEAILILSLFIIQGEKSYVH